MPRGVYERKPKGMSNIKRKAISRGLKRRMTEITNLARLAAVEVLERQQEERQRIFQLFPELRKQYGRG